MTDIQVAGRPETEWEKDVGDWFKKQSLASLDTLEAAARTILSLVTALIGTLFGVLTVAADKLPAYMDYPAVRGLGVVSAGALLAALIGALGVLLPARSQASSHRPDEQAQAFERFLEHKSRWLKVTVVAFGVGVGTLTIVLVAALLT
ncbi:MAG: hypothetical protein SXV54_11355 [Chloroflexota bacterium]|nr:hypothetical protein [Chloroflexota bacterium]